MKFWQFSEVVWHIFFGFFIFSSFFEILAEFWPKLHVIPHSKKNLNIRNAQRKFGQKLLNLTTIKVAEYAKRLA